MQKDKSTIKKRKRYFGQGLGLAALCLCLLLSCTQDETVLPAAGNTCRATLCLNVSSFGQRGTDGITRSVAGNTDEDLVKDLWVFQFSATDDSLLKPPVYISANQLEENTDEIDTEFIQNGSGESSIVCVVANTNSPNWATDENNQVRTGFATYTNFQQRALPDSVSRPFLSSNMGATGGYTIPMYGESRMVIASKSYVRVPLIRMFAKVVVFVDPSYPHEMNMAIDKITYFSIPLYSRVKAIEGSGEYPDSIVWNEFAAGNADEYFLYIPENIQGVVDDMTNKMEAWRLQPDLFPEKALAIHIDMLHKVGKGNDADSHIHEYTVYPGMNMKNDFNIKRNHIYNVIIKITSSPSTDPIIPLP